MKGKELKSASMEKWHENNVVFEGKVIRLRVGSVTLDDASLAYREVIEHPGGACILPFTGTGFVFVSQYRIALEKQLIEAPAGKLEVGESPEQCAIKELREETGFEAENIISMGTIYSSVGYCNELIHLYLAVGLTQRGSQLEPEERIEPVFMSIEEVRNEVANFGFTDSKTAVVAQRALAWLDRAGN